MSRKELSMSLQLRRMKLVEQATIYLLAASLTAMAQQVTGTLGSAGATTTVDGKQLPAPPPKFGGVIKESAKDSTPWWPPRVVTPFKWTKQVASHFGGTRQGLAISWPGHIKDVGAIRMQFHHVIDIVPTILEAAGVQAPVTVNGIAQRPIEGVSMAYTFDQGNANAPSTRTTQYFEMASNGAIYHDGWIAATTPFAPPWDLATGTLPDVIDFAAGVNRTPIGFYQAYPGLSVQDIHALIADSKSQSGFG
jgi:hypothetical protein